MLWPGKRLGWVWSHNLTNFFPKSCPEPKASCSCQTFCRMLEWWRFWEVSASCRNGGMQCLKAAPASPFSAADAAKTFTLQVPTINFELTQRNPKFVSNWLSRELRNFSQRITFLQRESDMRFESGSLTSNVPGTSIASLASCESVALFESDEAGPMDHLHQQVE